MIKRNRVVITGIGVLAPNGIGLDAFWKSLLAGESGQSEEAIALTEQALALCTKYGDRHREAALHNNLADLLHAAGRQAESMANLKQAIAIFAEIGAESKQLQPEIWKLSEW